MIKPCVGSALATAAAGASKVFPSLSTTANIGVATAAHSPEALRVATLKRQSSDAAVEMLRSLEARVTPPSTPPSHRPNAGAPKLELEL